jgi:hypothetical protein
MARNARGVIADDLIGRETWATAPAADNASSTAFASNVTNIQEAGEHAGDVQRSKR